MRLFGQVLSQEERELVHKKSIQILEEVGIKFPSERALTLLEKHGAKIDWDKQLAYISEAMVKEAMAKAPKEFVLGGREPEFDVMLPSADTIYNLDGGGIWTYEYETGKRRPSGIADITNATRVFDEVDIGNVIWAPVSLSQGEIPSGAGGIFGIASVFKNYRKHMQDEIVDTREVEYMVGILKAITGSIEEVKRRKIYSVCYCTISPLAHEAEMLEANMDLSHYGVPIHTFPMPALGSTGPASLYSNLAMSNAETLSIFVLFQCESPGVPIIFGNASGSTNKRSGVILEGAVEGTLVNCAMQDMASYYGFPSEMAGCLSDAKEPGMQAVLEKTLSSLPFVLAGTDIIQGIGYLEASMTLSLEQILIDEEIAMMCKRLKDGINFSPEMDFFEDIKAVGPTGHFLKQKNTRAAFRSSEYYNPVLADRDTYEDWGKLGSPDMYKNAHKRVKEILASEQKAPLPVNVVKEIDEIVEEALAVFET